MELNRKILAVFSVMVLAASSIFIVCNNDESSAATYTYTIGDSTIPYSSGTHTLYLTVGDSLTILRSGSGTGSDNCKGFDRNKVSLPPGMSFTNAASGSNRISGISGTVTSVGDWTLEVSHYNTRSGVLPDGIYVRIVVSNPSFTTSFNSMGGSGCAAQTGTSIILPTTVRDGYTFNGWYTAASGGSLVGMGGAAYTPSSNLTLYAHWSIVLNVSNLTVVAGQNLTLTPVADPNAEVSVSGADWLSVTNNVVYGVAPPTPDTYSVTVTANGISDSFTITVVSSLAPTNSPSAGAIIFPR